jgi:quercetin dioxygenase-like cupin family protein
MKFVHPHVNNGRLLDHRPMNSIKLTMSQTLEEAKMTNPIRTAMRRPAPFAAIFTGVGLAFGFLGASGLAQVAPPSKHEGITVKTLGAIPAESVKATVGLDGHILLLREITIAPGGQIAKHSHATSSGIVQMVSGEWIEGREDGEQNLTADSPALLEDENTVHWFYNRGAEPATAIVCDIKPAS